MKQIVFIILTLIFAQPAFSANSLDELYRDLIRADNEGYLPLFVKNRKVPDILSDDKIFDISCCVKCFFQGCSPVSLKRNYFVNFV